jgi:hypothetical protein
MQPWMLLWQRWYISASYCSTWRNLGTGLWTQTEVLVEHAVPSRLSMFEETLPGIQQSKWYRLLLTISVKHCDWHRNASSVLFCRSGLMLAKMYVCHFCTFVKNVGHSFLHPSDVVNDVTYWNNSVVKFFCHVMNVCWVSYSSWTPVV